MTKGTFQKTVESAEYDFVLINGLKAEVESLQSQLAETQHKLDISEKKVKLNYDSVINLEKQLAESQKRENSMARIADMEQNIHIDLLEKLAKAEADKVELLEMLRSKEISGCHHYFIQTDTYYKTCSHCGVKMPIW
jgi:DnaJ-class molecular chaperone